MSTIASESGTGPGVMAVSGAVTKIKEEGGESSISVVTTSGSKSAALNPTSNNTSTPRTNGHHNRQQNNQRNRNRHPTRGQAVVQQSRHYSNRSRSSAHPARHQTPPARISFTPHIDAENRLFKIMRNSPCGHPVGLFRYHNLALILQDVDAAVRHEKAVGNVDLSAALAAIFPPATTKGEDPRQALFSKWEPMVNMDRVNRRLAESEFPNSKAPIYRRYSARSKADQFSNEDRKLLKTLAKSNKNHKGRDRSSSHNSSQVSEDEKVPLETLRSVLGTMPSLAKKLKLPEFYQQPTKKTKTNGNAEGLISEDEKDIIKKVKVEVSDEESDHPRPAKSARTSKTLRATPVVVQRRSRGGAARSSTGGRRRATPQTQTLKTVKLEDVSAEVSESSGNSTPVYASGGRGGGNKGGPRSRRQSSTSDTKSETPITITTTRKNSRCSRFSSNVSVQHLEEEEDESKDSVSTAADSGSLSEHLRPSLTMSNRSQNASQTPRSGRGGHGRGVGSRGGGGLHALATPNTGAIKNKLRHRLSASGGGGTPTSTRGKRGGTPVTPTFAPHRVSHASESESKEDVHGHLVRDHGGSGRGPGGPKKRKLSSSYI